MKSREQMKEYNREYYLKDGEHWKALSRNYYHQNKERIKEYRLKNKERIKEYDRDYSLKNKERIKERRCGKKELKVGVEAVIDGDTASSAVTMLLPNLRNFEHCDGIRTNKETET